MLMTGRRMKSANLMNEPIKVFLLLKLRIMDQGMNQSNADSTVKTIFLEELLNVSKNNKHTTTTIFTFLFDIEVYRLHAN